MKRFLAPRWIAAHLLVAALAVACVGLGRWQLRRLDERRTVNRLLQTRSTGEAVPIEVGAQAYRPITATGTYDAANEVVLLNRPRSGRPGNHVLTPLRMDDGTALLVDRGWVPFELDTPPVPAAAPPSVRVTVTGVLFPSQPGGAANERRFSRPDVDAIGNELPYGLRPHWLHLTEQDPQPGALPRIEPLPEPSEGPHLSYAVQWFSFAALGLVGYAVILRRSARTGPSGSRTQVAQPM